MESLLFKIDKLKKESCIWLPEDLIIAFSSIQFNSFALSNLKLLNYFIKINQIISVKRNSLPSTGNF